MTFEEAVTAIKSSTHHCGIACDSDEDCEMHGLMTCESAFEIICKLKETYAPKIKMTLDEYEAFNKRFKTAMMSGFKIELDKKGEERAIFTETELIAWLHPELIEIEVVDMLNL